MKQAKENERTESCNIREMSARELISLIGKPVYAIRNYHTNTNRRNFYVSTWEISNIIFSQDGVWIDTGFEIFHESELGNRFSFNREEIEKTLAFVRSQSLNNISQIFKIHVIDRDRLLTRRLFCDDKENE